MRDPRSTRLETIMTRHVIHTTPDTPMRQAAQTMLDEGVSGLPVLDPEGRIVGIVTLSDVVFALSRRPGPPPSPPAGRLFAGDAELPGVVQWLFPIDTLGESPVSDFMSASVLAVAPRDSIHQAAAIMARNLVHRVLVVEDSRPVGIVSSIDVLAWLTDASDEQGGVTQE